jgi:pimeloyl-ACP methyl ester carboxylesterase
MVAWRAVMSTLALIGGAWSGAPTAAPITLTPCTLPDVPAPAKCGTMTVLENRVSGRGRSIQLRVVVIPAALAPPEPDAVTYFDGGPGEAATSSAGFVFHLLAPLHRRHDILLVDQRGTGESSPLTCHAFGAADSMQRWLGSFLPLDAIQRCVTDLSAHADLTVYTTNNHVDDVDDVRAALGYPMLDITGISYGSRAALTYLKRHGGHVRAMVIQGIAPTSDFIPETFAQDAQRALDGVFADCAAEPACHTAFPHLSDEMRSVVARLEQAPAPVAIVHPVTGELVTVTLNRDLFGEAIRYMMYSSGGASWVPAVVHAAAAGDLTPVAERAVLFRYQLLGTGTTGLYLAVTCDEDLPFVDVAKSTALGQTTFLGNYRLRDQSAACTVWPHAAVDAHFAEPTRSAVPALVLSGQRDPVTPPENGALAATTLSRSRHIVIPGGGHSYDGLIGTACVDSLWLRFIATPDPQALDTHCVAGIHRPPFPTALIWSHAIALDAAALRRFAGRFEGATTRLEHGALWLSLDGDTSRLVPIAPTRFWVVGDIDATVTFRLPGDAPTALIVERGGRPVRTLPAAR